MNFFENLWIAIKAACKHVIWKYVNILIDYTVKCIIIKPTRVTSTTNSVIEHIYTDNLNHIVSGIDITDLSDHYSVRIYDSSSTLSKSKAKNELMKRNLEKFYKKLFLQQLTERLDFFQLWNDMPLDGQYKNVVYIFKDVINEHALIKQISRK